MYCLCKLLHVTEVLFIYMYPGALLIEHACWKEADETDIEAAKR